MMNSTQLNIRAYKPFLTEKDKTMSNFDFQKAINGEPIYCNGQIITDINYNIRDKRFYNSYNTWDANGKLLSNNYKGADITTDPPKKKVNKTVWVHVGNKDWLGHYPVSFAHEEKEKIFNPFTKDRFTGTYPIEIEVEE